MLSRGALNTRILHCSTTVFPKETRDLCLFIRRKFSLEVRLHHTFMLYVKIQILSFYYLLYFIVIKDRMLLIMSVLLTAVTASVHLSCFFIKQFVWASTAWLVCCFQFDVKSYESTEPEQNNRETACRNTWICSRMDYFFHQVLLILSNK